MVYYYYAVVLVLPQGMLHTEESGVLHDQHVTVTDHVSSCLSSSMDTMTR